MRHETNRVQNDDKFSCQNHLSYLNQTPAAAPATPRSFPTNSTTPSLPPLLLIESPTIFIHQLESVLGIPLKRMDGWMDPYNSMV